MTKKISLILLVLFLVVGCTRVENTSLDTLLSETATSSKLKNIYRAGYTYYVPKGMRLLSHEESNEILEQENHIYYMYVDRVSYYKKIKKDYKINANAYYSRAIEGNNMFGYVEIKNTENNKYFIEIMYNYAKIEVIVDKEKDTNKAVTYAMSILSSINYQDKVLDSLMSEDILKTNEVEHNIFESAETESGYLKIVEEYGQYEDKEDNVDPDFIRK